MIGPLAAAPTTGALLGRRWRLADLGAGEELRDHELARRWAWQPAPTRSTGERVYIRSQGEIIRERPWPDTEPYVPMTGELDGPRLPRSEGQHIFSCGGTGAGKTTSALRIVAARTLADRSAVLAIDQKGDEQAERTLRDIAAAADVPFILIDPRAPDTDRWQPISGDVGEVVAQGRRADQGQRGVLLGHAPALPGRRRPGARARRLLAAVAAVPDRLLPAAPLPADPRALLRRRGAAPPRGRGGRLDLLAGRPQGGRRRRGPPAGRDGRSVATGARAAGSPRPASTSRSASRARSSSVPSCCGAPTSTTCPRRRR